MLGKNNQFMNQKKAGRKFEKYSIKKLKVGAASVLVGAGFFLGFHVEASEVNEPVTNEVVSSSTKENKEKVVTVEEKSIETTPFAENKLSEEKNSKLAVEKLSSTDEVKKIEQLSVESKATVETSQLSEKITALQEQVNRIRSNEKQKSFIEKAEKLLEEAKVLQASSKVTQDAVDAKAKEISSLTSILKSIKAEETPKENKNQDSRNGKKMEEGTGFRTGVTEQALTGSIHFDNSNGPIEKQIPVENNGDGERVINMAITYSASSSETVTDGKVRVTIPKAFLHSTKKPEFKNSSFVKSVDDLSTTTNYVYDLNLNPMSGGTVAESLLKLYVGTSIKNAPSRGDILSVNTDFIAGGETLSTKSARASFDYLSEILYREKEWRTKTVKYMVDQFGAPLPEFKMGSVSNGTFKPIEGNTFKLPFIMSDQSFFNNEETNQNGNGRLTSYDYTISGIPDFLELDPTNIKNNKFWTLENGVLTLHPDENKGIDQSLLYGGPILKVKEGAFNTPEAIERVIESNSTKGFNANIVYKAVGHRPDGSTFTQTLDNPDGFRLYLGDGIPAIKEMDTRIFPETNQRLYSHASNEDKFNARFSIPNDKLKGDGAFLPSQYINYFIPKDQEGNYFTKFQLNRVYTNEIKADGSREFRGYYREKLEGNLKENFKLYGVTKDNQAELLKEYTSIDELYNTIEINPEKKYEHLILKHPGIVDEFQRYNSTSKTITGLDARLGVTVGTWKEKAQDSTIQRYRNEIAQGSTSENTIESAIAMERPATGSGEVAEHIKTPSKLTLNMNQIGSQTLTKDDLTRGQTIPIAVTYSAEDYFGLIESDNDGSKTYDINKLDPNITKTSVMLLADPKLPLKDFRLAADNRLLSKYTLHFGGTNGDAAKESYDKLKESYDTVNPTNIIENYKGTGKRAYIFDSKDLNLTGYDLNRWIKGGLYSPTALTFEVENNGQVEAGTYGIESYLVWNSESETLIGNDNSINANFVENHEPGLSISKANINVTINNIAEYSSSLTIAKPGTTGVRGIIDVKNGQEVILSPQIENLTDLPQKVKEAVVLIPKTEALTYLEGPIVDDSDEYDVVYTTSTATDKTTGTYVSAAQITNWKDVTAVKYVFKNNYTITKEHAFKHHFNLRVDQNNPNYVRSTSQIFLKDGKDTWLESNVVGLRTEDVRGKLEVYYKTVDGELLKEFPKTRDFEGQPYATTKEPILKGFVNRWYAVNDYIFIKVQPDSAPEIGTYERQVTKKVTYLYDKAKVKVETKDITRTINYIEKNNEGNIISNQVIQKVTVSRKVYTGEKTGRVVEDNWEIPANAKWESVISPTPSEWEKPEVKVNDQYIAKAAIDEVRITPEILNNGNIVENVYYERFVPVGGDVVAKYVIEGTTTELKTATDVAKGLKVGKSYTSTAPVVGEELTATDGKVYVYKGHKTTSAAEMGTVTADKQEVVYEYAPKVGGDVEVKYVIAGTEENLKNPVALVTNGQVGSDYTATKDATITKEDGRVYKLVAANNGLKTDSAGETGKVTTEKQTVTYEYELQKGDVTVNYTDVDGQPIEGKPSVKAENQSETGKQYNTNTPELKPTTITTPSGKVYKLVPDQTVGKENGKVTVEPTEVTYKYELQKGDVTVNYTDVDGQPIEGKPSVKAENQSETGKQYNTDTPELKPTTITTPSGKVYKLVPDQTVGKENGKVTVEPTEVTYKYELQKGDVTVNYTDVDGQPIEGKPSVKAENQSETGKQYNTDTPELKPTTITTPSSKVYKLVPDQTVGKENGKVTVEPTEVTYKYELQKGDVTVNYTDTEGNPIEGKPSVKAENQSETGKQYNTDTPELKPTTITTPSGKVYKLVPDQTVGKENGKVTVEPTEVTYKYELQKGDVTVNYTDTEGNPIEGKPSVKAENQSETGKQYNTDTPELKPTTITTPSGKVYKLVLDQTVGKENGKVTVEPTEVTYKYELQKGDVTVNYTDTEGNPIEGKPSVKAENQSETGKQYNTDTPELKPTTITTPSGKVYKLVPDQTVGKENGKVTVEPTEVTYKYELQKGDVTVNYTDTEGNPIEGKPSVKAENQSETGKQYNTDTPELKPTTITTPSGKVYKLVPDQTVGKENGKVTVEPTEVTYKYELQKGDVTVNYTDTEGNPIEGKPSVKAENQSATGTDYNTNIPELKPTTITTPSGKVYKLVPEQTVGKENGKVTVEPTEVTYKYELQKGDVTVNYTDTEGNPIEGKPSVKAENQSETGKQYNTDTPELKSTTITTPSGKVYKLVPEQTVGKENGKVTVEPTEVTYKYELQKGDVTVNYRDTEGNEIEGKPSVKAENQSATGTDYNTNIPELKPTTITTPSGKVYKLVPEQTVGKENGKVTVEPTEVTYKYELQKGDVTVNYTDTEGNPIEGKPSVKAENQSETGKQYNTDTPELKSTTITTTSGKVYKLVPEQTVGKENGKVTVEPTEVTYKYELQKGDVTVNYRDTEGNEIEGKPSVKAENQSATGTDYNTNTPELKPTTITTPSGKVYKLVPEQTVGKENGKVTVEPTEVTYKYELQKGDVTVNYRDTEGNEIEGKPSVKAENQSATGTDYNTNTPELKPTTITTPSGKVYKLVPAQTVGKENGKVTVEPTEVTYKYELQKGDVTVNYTDTEGNPIEGKPSVKAENQSETGKQYNTDTTELKLTTITTPSGKVYKLVPDQTVGKENGKVTVEPTEVTYKYELQKGDVTVNYTDTEGNPIEGKPSVKAENQSATGTDYNTNTPELKPTTITTPSGKVYKLVPAQTVGKENGKVTVEPTEVTYKYELQKGDVTVNYTDVDGQPIEGKPSVKAETQSPTGKEYNTNTPELKPETITTANGDVYEFVKKSETSASETGKVNTGVTTVEYVYRKVVTSYVDEEGKEINPSDKGTKDKKDIPEYIYKETKKDEKGNTTHVYRQVVTSYVDETGKEINPSDKGTKDKKDIPEYIYKETKKDEKGNTTHVYRQVVTSYVDEEGKEINPSDKGTKDKKDIPEYIYKETKKDKDGNTTHVYRQVVTSYVNEEGKEINPSDKGTKNKKDIPEYIYKETKKDEKGNTIHVYRQVVTSYVDEEGKEINPSDKGTKDKKDIPEYIYKETKKDEKGNTTYVYRQVVTSYVDEEGKEINPSDKGTKDKKDIPEYIFKETKKDEKGNTTHVYRQVVTSYVDEEGKEINPSDKGTKDKKDIPEYIFKETKKDEKGNTIHVYRQVVTSYVDEEGKEINPSDKGTKDKKEISGYTFKETKKDKNGNTIHVYTKKSSSTPETPKPTPETPNKEESKSTIWKSVDGETLKPRENGTKDKTSIPGYEFVRTEKDKEGNTVHLYRKVTASTPEVKGKETSYVDENGKEIRSPKKGNHPKENIPGYEFVRTETESNGNVRHVYRQVVHSESKVETPTTVEERKNELPNTGTGDEFTIFGAAAASILAGLGIAIPGKKKED